MRQIVFSNRCTTLDSASADTLAAMVESSDEAILANSLDGTITAWNRGAQQLYGYAASEAIGQGVQMLFPGDHNAEIQEFLSRIRRGLSVRNHESVQQCKDGKQFEISVSLSPIKDPQGEITGVLAVGHDISKRKAAEAALRESESQYRLLAEIVPQLVWRCTPDGLNDYFNQHWVDYTGLSLAESYGERWVTPFHDEDKPKAWAAWSRAVATGETYRVDCRLRAADGSYRWFLIKGVPMRDDGGKIVQWFGTCTDIHDLKQTETALRASEARFRSFFDLDLMGMVVTNIDKRIAAVNARACQILGYGADELLGMDWTRITYPDDIDAGLDQFPRLMRGEIEHFTMEKRYIRKDGTLIWTSLSIGCVRKADGKVDYFCGIMQDISERKAAEEKVHKAEEKFRQIFEDAPEGIFQITKEGKGIALNPAGLKMFGYTSIEEAMDSIKNGDSVHWVHEREHARFGALMEERGEATDFQCELKRTNGPAFWASITGRAIRGASGETLYYQGFVTDVSEEKRLRIALQTRVRELQVLSEMNAALVAAEDEPGLLKEYCRIMVETGGYRMAWVGFAEGRDGSRIVPVAHCGYEDGYLDGIHEHGEGGELCGGPTCTSIRTGTIQYVDELRTDKEIPRWRAEALACGYRSAIALPLLHSDGSVGCLTAYAESPGSWTESERKLLAEIAGDLGYGITTLRSREDRKRHQEELRVSLEQTIQVIAETVEQRDAYTAGHQRRVADLAKRIAQKMGLAEDRVHGLHLAASIHDLGKIGVPAEILSKPVRLTALEFSLIKEHAQQGYEILRDVRFPWPIADMIRQHHERMDGSGYPLGLVGSAILLESRIMAVADVVEAMASHRPYRPAKGIEKALQDIQTGRGKLYDGDAVDACVRVFEEDKYEFPE